MHDNPTLAARPEGSDHNLLRHVLLLHELGDPYGTIRMVTGRLTRMYNAAQQELDEAWQQVCRYAERHRSAKVAGRSGQVAPPAVRLTVESFQRADAAVTRWVMAAVRYREVTHLRDALRLTTGRPLDPVVRIHSASDSGTLAWAYGGDLAEDDMAAVARLADTVARLVGEANQSLSLAEAYSYLVPEVVARLRAEGRIS